MIDLRHKWPIIVIAFLLLALLVSVNFGTPFLAGRWPSLSRGIDLAPISAHFLPVQMTSRPLTTEDNKCSGHFVSHALPHTTTTADGIVRSFAANGAGLAVNDLDNDGVLDLVLGAEVGANTVLWNNGDLTFTKTTFGEGPTRAVTIIDVDGDGRRDIVLTTNRGLLHYWHNQGARTFARQVLPGIAHPAYAINWADLDLDGDLDLVTASYDAAFLTEIGNEYLLGDSAGVYVYENRNGMFRPTRLASSAQALALALWDIDRDGRLDIWVGNDFAVPDYIWLQRADGWQSANPFAVTSYSTMSLDQGDIDNDGISEFLSADMNPYETSPATLAQWLPVMNEMERGARLRNDPQTMANALQHWQNGHWQEIATARGVRATGWSWTSRFGDLDNDGFLALYVVNGMIETGTFGYLPNHELVEENQIYRNDGQGYFVAMPAWQLGATQSGRSMVMADLDHDGDLDVVINNLRAAAQLMENQLCRGRTLLVTLQWLATQNRDSIGAKVQLTTSVGVMSRDVRAVSGYLSGDAPTLHFGLPLHATVTALLIEWPDGMQSRVAPVAPDSDLTIVRAR